MLTDASLNTFNSTIRYLNKDLIEVLIILNVANINYIAININLITFLFIKKMYFTNLSKREYLEYNTRISLIKKIYDCYISVVLFSKKASTKFAG